MWNFHEALHISGVAKDAAQEGNYLTAYIVSLELLNKAYDQGWKKCLFIKYCNNLYCNEYMSFIFRTHNDYKDTRTREIAGLVESSYERNIHFCDSCGYILIDTFRWDLFNILFRTIDHRSEVCKHPILTKKHKREIWCHHCSKLAISKYKEWLNNKRL
jgi:hypothetical protein